MPYDGLQFDLLEEEMSILEADVFFIRTILVAAGANQQCLNHIYASPRCKE